MTARQLLAIVVARWRLAAGVVALAVTIALLLTWLLPRQYTANASVVIDIKGLDPIVGTTSPALLAPSYMATQVDIMESERIAQQVVRALKLGDSAEMRRDWRDDTGGSGNFEVWLANRLRRKLDIRPARESNLIEIRFTSVDAKFAAAVANAFAQAYLDITLELRTDSARRYSTFFDERAKQLRDDLERAQARLAKFQKSRGIVGADERLDVETARLNDLSTQLTGLQAVTADSRAKGVAGATAADALADVIANPTIAGLRADLAKAEVRLHELAERVGDRHPQLIEQRAAVAELKAKIEQETRRLSSSLAIGHIISESREAQVRAALEAQRERLLKLKDERSQLALLQREVEAAQRAYDGVAARLSQVSLESLTTQTNAMLLMAATEPSKPSFPRLVVNLPLGAIVGVLLAIAAVLGREAADRRIRNADDIAAGLQAPVLGALLDSAPKRRRARKELPSWLVRRSASA